MRDKFHSDNETAVAGTSKYHKMSGVTVSDPLALASYHHESRQLMHKCAGKKQATVSTRGLISARHYASSQTYQSGILLIKNCPLNFSGGKRN
jgi:hypothetical protein